MSSNLILWDRDDDPKGNVQHIAQHNLTKEDVEDVVAMIQKRPGEETSENARHRQRDVDAAVPAGDRRAVDASQEVSSMARDRSQVPRPQWAMGAWAMGDGWWG